MFIAITENEILRKITDGENKGKLMNYHHVVRSLTQLPKNQKTIEIPIEKDWDSKKLSMVVFLQDKNYNIIQSSYDNSLKDCVVKK